MWWQWVLCGKGWVGGRQCILLSKRKVCERLSWGVDECISEMHLIRIFYMTKMHEHYKTYFILTAFTILHMSWVSISHRTITLSQSMHYCSAPVKVIIVWNSGGVFLSVLLGTHGVGNMGATFVRELDCERYREQMCCLDCLDKLMS